MDRTASASLHLVVLISLLSASLIESRFVWNGSTPYSTTTPTVCEGGQVWNECGSACTPSCADPRPTCTDQCVPRCECPKDKPIWHLGNCIAETQCTVCDGGQIWMECGSACTRNCVDPNPVCTLQCVSRCQCPNDKPILREGICITETQCKAACTGGQIWKDCGSACTSTCDSPNPTCTMQCIARCECPNDKPIWREGNCIAETDCKACIGGQIWKDCGSACVRTCEKPNPICTAQCVAHCECPNDKPIWREGNCVMETDCKACTGGQIWKDCGSACTRTCDNPDPICTKHCVSRCECPNDKPILHEGTCIAKTQC